MRYGTIVLDPPWSYVVSPKNEPSNREDYLRRDGTPTKRSTGPTADAHYATMNHAQIAALPVGDLAADQGHIYLWVTNPRLFADKRGDGPTPAEMLKGWGFEYITMLTWHKLGAPGLGWYYRGDTEHVLFGTKGKLGIPTALRRSNFFEAPKRRHSEKPNLFFKIVEERSPAPRLEMFARSAREGWDSWGFEAPSETAVQIGQEDGWERDASGVVNL